MACGHGVLGDRVEGHAADGRILLDRLALFQRLLEVPADRLPLAVGVGGEDQVGVVLQRVGDRLDVFLAVGRDLPRHVEAVLGIDRPVLGRQVADMAVGGENRVVGAEIFVDRLGLGGRFDDDDGHEAKTFGSGTGCSGATCGASGWLVNASSV
jgi:hypothetical protein